MTIIKEKTNQKRKRKKEDKITQDQVSGALFVHKTGLPFGFWEGPWEVCKKLNYQL